MKTIAAIPADSVGGKLWIKDFRVDGDKLFVKYKSTYNDIPFKETEIFNIDNNFVITGADGTVLFRFNIGWIDKIK